MEKHPVVDTNRKTVTLRKAAEICGVSRRTVYNWINAKKVTSLRTPGGGQRLYLDELLREEQVDA